ncbi:hypothetical protein FQN54_003211 [Arachnomyces sp. PD_36]|nr:hypothetical protein FQN54_003211 [Arachnomyces sp. PD_36]
MSSQSNTKDQIPEMSAASKALLAKARKLVPPMLEKFHKGQLGRVAVIGGSIDYTGAPYFSAMASARLGCDMSHVICEPSAATVIKSYSPNLMVHPLLQSSTSASNSNDQKPQSLASPIISFLSRLHVLVIGPGLGRDPLTQKIVIEIMKEARSRCIPLVLDADALLLVQENPDLVRGYKECILTPNVVEFARLAKALGVDEDVKQSSDKKDASKKVSNALGGVVVIQKGGQDHISNGEENVVADMKGGLKRSGGQGDTLTGSLGTLLAWRKAYHDGLWDSEEEGGKMSPSTTLLVAAWAGSTLTRECSRRAFAIKGRSMQASDLTDEVHGSFLSLIGEPEGSKL